MTDEELLKAPQPRIYGRSVTRGVVEKCGLCGYKAVSRTGGAAVAALTDHFNWAHKLGGETAQADAPEYFIQAGRPSEAANGC